MMMMDVDEGVGDVLQPPPHRENEEEEEGEGDAALRVKREEEMRTKYEQREYQMYLYQRAIEANVVICLPTGCGKTFIAFKAVKHFLPQADADKKKIVFVATTVPLVNQQGRYLKNHLDLNFEKQDVCIITGDKQPEDWDGSQWKATLRRHTVFSMTDEILRSAIERNHITLSDLALLILDECHNATNNHPMARLMEFYRKDLKSGKVVGVSLPRVIGLSATIIQGNSSVDRIPEDIRDVENMFCSRAITYHNYEEVIRCATQANTSIKGYDPPPEWRIVDEADGNISLDLSNVLSEIRDGLDVLMTFTLEDSTAFFKGLREDGHRPFLNGPDEKSKMLREVEQIDKILKELGPFCAYNAVLFKLTYLKYLKNKLRTKALSRAKNTRTGEDFVLNYLKSKFDLLERLLQYYMFYASPKNADEGCYAKMFISPKLKALAELLSDARQQKDDFCGIIFCKERIVAQMVCFYIQDLQKYCEDDFGFLKCTFVLGSGNRYKGGGQGSGAQTTAMKKQLTILDKFRRKEFNLLVATNVLEEGLDVPSCNFICRFDAITSFPSFIQSMGRARQQHAKFYALVCNDDVDKEDAKLNGFKQFSGALSEGLIKNAEITEEYDIDEEGENDDCEDDILPPFRPVPDGAQITAGSAIKTVYRYCQLLCRDKLSVISPYCTWKPVEVREENIPKIKFEVIVRLPPGAVVEMTKSKLYETKAMAKKAACLEMCRLLYDKGALHPVTLLPIPQSSLPSYIDQFMSTLDSKMPKSHGGYKVGSKKRLAWYLKKEPNELKTGGETKNWATYVIKLSLSTSQYYGGEEAKVLYDFEERSYYFGILTFADLSKIPEFLLCARDGGFKVVLEKVTMLDDQNAPFELTETGLGKIKLFQKLLFCEDKELFGFAHPVFQDSISDSYYVVPLEKRGGSFHLSVDVINKLENNRLTDYRAGRQVAEHREFCFEESVFENAFLIPTYEPKYHSTQRYCVIRIEKHKTSGSPFDDLTKATTYDEYYKRKHQVTIVNRQCPLVRAKAISKQLNFLVPKRTYKNEFEFRATLYQLSKEERKSMRHTSFCVTLIPELMHVHPLPGTLFIQSKFIPSTIHRIFRLLLADEMRESMVGCQASQNSDSLRTQYLSAMCQQAGDIFRLNSAGEREQPLNTTVDAVAFEFVRPIDTKQVNSPGNREQDEFSTNRKLRWVEIEYIHPKDSQKLNLDDCYSSDDDEDDSMNGGCSPTSKERIGMSKQWMHVLNSYTARIISVELVPSSDVPMYNFHAVAKDLPLVEDIMEALTLSNGNDILSLERLEMIGDSVLKLIVTLHIHSHFPKLTEGQMTALRTKYISNRHLYNIGVGKNLGDYLAGSLFHPDFTWLPPGKIIPENFMSIAVENDVNYNVYKPIELETGAMDRVDFFNETEEDVRRIVRDRVAAHSSRLDEMDPAQRHTSYSHSRLGDKSIADCVEALIGAFYSRGGLSGALHVMEWLGLKGIVDSAPPTQAPFQNVDKLPKYSRKYPQSAQRLISNTQIGDLERLLDYKFNNQWLLVEALTHPSNIANSKYTGTYERLEFLGDAVLDFLVTHHIYNDGKVEQSPGKLTDLRSSLVNNVTFGCQTVRYGFHKLLLHFSQPLETIITEFVCHQDIWNHEVTEPFKYITDEDTPGSVAAGDIDVPKALGDIFESLAGAVFLDSNMNLDTVWRVFYRLMKHEIDKFSKEIPLQPIRQLHEWYPNGIKFKVDEDKEKGVYLATLKVLKKKPFLGCGRTKKSAKLAAAKFAIKTLGDEKRKAQYHFSS